MQMLSPSPLGRGFLTGTITSTAEMGDKDFRKTNPRFQPGNLERNLELAEQVKRLPPARGVRTRAKSRGSRRSTRCPAAG